MLSSEKCIKFEKPFVWPLFWHKIYIEVYKFRHTRDVPVFAIYIHMASKYNIT